MWRTFPNYDENTEQRIIDLADINPNKLGKCSINTKF